LRKFCESVIAQYFLPLIVSYAKRGSADIAGIERAERIVGGWKYKKSDSPSDGTSFNRNNFRIFKKNEAMMRF